MSDQTKEQILRECDESMAKAIAHTGAEFAQIRTGRASTALVDRIKVECYGAQVPLQQMAGVSVPDAGTLVISPYDKGTLGDIEKAIQESDLGINPSNDGNVVRLAIPQLTQERRKELVKVAKAKAEDGRVSVRSARRTARQQLEKLEKAGDLSSDELDRTEKVLDSKTKKSIDEVDRLLAQKEKDLLEV